MLNQDQTPRGAISLVIPAHNEATVVKRCLERLHEGAGAGELDVVVVCNGCTDDTAAIAREVNPDVTVIELPTASKSQALNVGDAAARYFPRFFIDADVEVGLEAIRATAAALESDWLCAAPVPEYHFADCSRAVRLYYKIHRRMYRDNGVYALSREGRARFSEFPDILADDQFVIDRFGANERTRLEDVTYTITPPANLRNLLRIRERAYRGAREVRRLFPGPRSEEPRSRALKRAARREGLICLLVWLAVNAVAKVRSLYREPAAWERDRSSRC